MSDNLLASPKKRQSYVEVTVQEILLFCIDVRLHIFVELYI